MNKTGLLLSALFLCGTTTAVSGIELSVGGQNELRAAIDSVDQAEPARYFQDWFDLSIGLGNFTLDLGFEAHVPPFPGTFAPQDTIGILRRSFSYSRDLFTITAGHYFTTLGNGIVLRSYEDRDLGWNTNIDGAHFKFSHDWIEGEFFGGKMRDTDGKRYELLQGGALRFMPGDHFYPGATGAVTKIDGMTHYWGSLTGELYLPFGQLKGEFAAFDFGKDSSGFTVQNMFTDWNNFLNHGRATYLNATIYAGPLTLFLEGKNYKKFALEDQALALNNPPTAVREHLFGLFADLNPDGFKGNNERGFLTELSGPFPGDNLFLLSYSNTRSEDQNELLFDELYGQFDVAIGPASTIIGAGFQQDEAGHYVHGGIHGELPIRKISLKGEFAHQHRTLTRNFDPAREFFYQTYELGIAWKSLVLSGIGAATSDPDKDDGDGLYTKGWFGGQFNWQFLDRHSLALFAGTRKDGKICAGGVCVKKPELKGVELTLTSSF